MLRLVSYLLLAVIIFQLLTIVENIPPFWIGLYVLIVGLQTVYYYILMKLVNRFRESDDFLFSTGMNWILPSFIIPSIIVMISSFFVSKDSLSNHLVIPIIVSMGLLLLFNYVAVKDRLVVDFYDNKVRAIFPSMFFDSVVQTIPVEDICELVYVDKTKHSSVAINFMLENEKKSIILMEWGDFDKLVKYFHERQKVIHPPYLLNGITNLGK